MYAKSCKQKRKLYKSEMIEKLQQLHDNDPKAYWKLLEDLKSDDSVRAEPQISSDEWTDHFSSLNEIKHKFMTRADEISNLLEQKENVKEFNELDFKITPDELHAATVSLKNNKAVGFYSISNEMLKAGYGALRKSLLKLSIAYFVMVTIQLNGKVHILRQYIRVALPMIQTITEAFLYFLA